MRVSPLNIVPYFVFLVILKFKTRFWITMIISKFFIHDTWMFYVFQGLCCSCRQHCIFLLWVLGAPRLAASSTCIEFKTRAPDCGLPPRLESWTRLSDEGGRAFWVSSRVRSLGRTTTYCTGYLISRVYIVYCLEANQVLGPHIRWVQAVYFKFKLINFNWYLGFTAKLVPHRSIRRSNQDRAVGPTRPPRRTLHLHDTAAVIRASTKRTLLYTCAKGILNNTRPSGVRCVVSI